MNSPDLGRGFFFARLQMTASNHRAKPSHASHDHQGSRAPSPAHQAWGEAPRTSHATSGRARSLRLSVSAWAPIRSRGLSVASLSTMRALALTTADGLARVGLGSQERGLSYMPRPSGEMAKARSMAATIRVSSTPAAYPPSFGIGRLP